MFGRGFYFAVCIKKDLRILVVRYCVLHISPPYHSNSHALQTTPNTGVPASLLLLFYNTRPRQRQDLNIVFYISLEVSPGANLGRASLDTTCSLKLNAFVKFEILTNHYRLNPIICNEWSQILSRYLITYLNDCRLYFTKE